MKKTLLVIAPGNPANTDGGEGVYVLLNAETGESLASHICSSIDWAMGDLYDHRPERKTEYAERFGEVEVKHLKDTDISIDTILRLNMNFRAVSKAEVIPD